MPPRIAPHLDSDHLNRLRRALSLELSTPPPVDRVPKGWSGREYEVLYVDFPWPYSNFGTAKLPYEPMSWSQIYRFPWHYFMAKRCVAFFWTTGPLCLDQLLACAVWRAHYGLRYLGIHTKWIKTRNDGTPIGAAGPRATLNKSLGEDLHAFTNVRRGRPFPLRTESQKQWLFAPKPKRGEHSTKPDRAAERIVELLGDRPRAELFGRKHRPGWDVIGDQSPHITKRIRF